MKVIYIILNESLVASDNLKFKFSTDGEGNYGYLGADGSFIPFKSSSEPIDLVGTSKYNFYVERNNDSGTTHTTITSTSVTDELITLSVSQGYYVTNGMKSYGVFFTEDYFDLTDHNFIVMNATYKFSSHWNQYIPLYLMDEGGNEINVTPGISWNNQYYYWDLTQYTGKYKIGFYLETYQYITGYGKEYSNMYISRLCLT